MHRKPDLESNEPVFRQIVRYFEERIIRGEYLVARDSEILDMGIRNKILFVPGGLYGAPRGYVKFSFARATTGEIEEGIHRFGETLKL